MLSDLQKRQNKTKQKKTKQSFPDIKYYAIRSNLDSEEGPWVLITKRVSQGTPGHWLWRAP